LPRWVVAFGAALLAAGCSGNGAGDSPVSPGDAGNQALAEYDANKDGGLDAKELEACPALQGGLKRADKNADGRLTADEIADRLAFFQQGMQMDVLVEVALDGRPLGGATVTLVPEKFMGSAVKPASVVTDEAGTGMPRTEGADGQPIAPGYYRVQVSKTVQGRELIPAKYNAQTVLGQEVAPDAEGRGSSTTLRFRLSSR
jgi:hypothetical protein